MNRILIVAVASLLVGMAPAADVAGLRKMTEVKITAQLVGVPLTADTKPSVWGMAFSPDGKYLAYGVHFARKKDNSFLSYLLVVSADQPDVVLKKFDIPRTSLMKNQVLWGLDGRFVGVTGYASDWTNVAVFDLTTNAVHIVSNPLGTRIWCQVVKLLAGPVVVEDCPSRPGNSRKVQFLRLDGSSARSDWTLENTARFLSVSDDGQRVALDFRSSDEANILRATHEIAIFNIEDHREIRRWVLPEAITYSGTFVRSGQGFCAMRNSVENLKAEITCWNIADGGSINRIDRAGATMGSLATAGDRVVLRQLSFFKIGKRYVPTHPDEALLEVATGKETARRRVDHQWVLPKSDALFQTAVSPNGNTVSVGGEGTLVVYAVK